MFTKVRKGEKRSLKLQFEKCRLAIRNHILVGLLNIGERVTVETVQA